MSESKLSLLPFRSELLCFDHRDLTWIELQQQSKLYGLVLSHITTNLVLDEAVQSFTVDVNPVANKSESVTDSDNLSRTNACVGLGSFIFTDTRGRQLRAIHQAIADPIGTDCGVQWLRTLVVFSPKLNDQENLQWFCEDLVNASEKKEEGYYAIFTWHIRHRYWREQTTCKARLIESVILSSKTKSRLFADVERFLNPKTKLFYESHGIPYRRSYLFHGLPGTGKTSLIQALAGRIKRNLYFIQPTDPEMTDDSLRSAVSSVPENAIVVIEDIDALFTKDRKKKVEKSPLTFSGLLNALDGVGSGTGQLFILTTNLRDELDPALIRNGRVDLHIQFGYAEDEQMRDMWNSFYPDASHLADTFVATLKETLGDRSIVMANLQHFFVQQMFKTPEEAVLDVGSIVEEIKQRESESQAAAVTETEDNANKDNKKEGKGGDVASESTVTDTESSNSDGKGKQVGEAGALSNEIHVHVHLHSSGKK